MHYTELQVQSKLLLAGLEKPGAVESAVITLGQEFVPLAGDLEALAEHLGVRAAAPLAHPETVVIIPAATP